jgi:hypothetical protein
MIELAAAAALMMGEARGEEVGAERRGSRVREVDGEVTEVVWLAL